MSRFILVFILSGLIFACNNNEEVSKKNFKDGKQIPFLDTTGNELLVIAPDTVLGGDEFYARITLSEKGEKLLGAYADCDFSKSLIDTAKKQPDNCQMPLEVIKDTVRFHIWPDDSTFSFSIPIALLSVNNTSDYKLRTLRLKINSKKKLGIKNN